MQENRCVTWSLWQIVVAGVFVVALGPTQNDGGTVLVGMGIIVLTVVALFWYGSRTRRH